MKKKDNLSDVSYAFFNFVPFLSLLLFCCKQISENRNLCSSKQTSNNRLPILTLSLFSFVVVGIASTTAAATVSAAAAAASIIVVIVIVIVCRLC